MKKLICVLLFGAFIFMLQGITLFADDFSNCVNLERLRAKSDGADDKKAIDQAEKICKVKFNRNTSRGGSENNTASVNKPDFSVDFLFGSKEVLEIDGLCKERGPEVYVEGYCDRHPASALLFDLYLTPRISIAFGSLASSFEHPDSNSALSLNFTTLELSWGGRFHFKKGRSKKGLDLFVGAGAVTIEACNKYEIESRDNGVTRVDFCGKKESGGYTEGGIKYVTRAGFSIGYYLRRSSPEKYGGDTRGLTLGWTW